MKASIPLKGRHRSVWIVEMWCDYVTPRWESTVGAAMSRSEAREVLAEWKESNVGRFRIVKYVPKP